MVKYNKIENEKINHIILAVINFFYYLGCLIINIVAKIIKGICCLFIDICKSIYKKLIKPYKYEFLYIAIIGAISLLILILCLTGMQNSQEITFLGNMHISINIGLIVIAGLFIAFGLYGYIRTIFMKKTVNEKWFWYIRALSYIVTVFLLVLLVDICILDFVGRYNTVGKPNSDTSIYDTMIFFLREYSPNFLSGVKTTLSLALLGTVIGLVLALIMVVLRMLKADVRDNDVVKLFKKIGSGFANIYVTVIRGTPMIVQAFVFYYLVASIFRANMSVEEYRNFIDNIWTPFRAGLFTVSINTTAYLTEVLRGGINSVDKGQSEACKALGFGKFRTMILVVFPQAIKNSLPSIGNEFIINIKDTSVLTMINVLDLFTVAKMNILGIYSARSLEAYLLIAIIYLILTYFTSKILQYIERKMDMPVKGITSSN